MSIAAAIDRALKTVTDRTGGNVCVWRGKELPCIAQNDQNSWQVKAGGFEGNPGLILLIRWPLWQTADSSLVLADDDTLTIDQAFDDATDGSITAHDVGDSGEPSIDATTEDREQLTQARDRYRRRRPVAGKQITYKGKVYRIDSAKVSLFKTHITLELGDVNR